MSSLPLPISPKEVAEAARHLFVGSFLHMLDNIIDWPRSSSCREAAKYFQIAAYVVLIYDHSMSSRSVIANMRLAMA